MIKKYEKLKKVYIQYYVLKINYRYEKWCRCDWDEKNKKKKIKNEFKYNVVWMNLIKKLEK